MLGKFLLISCQYDLRDENTNDQYRVIYTKLPGDTRLYQATVYCNGKIIHDKPTRQTVTRVKAVVLINEIHGGYGFKQQKKTEAHVAL